MLENRQRKVKDRLLVTECDFSIDVFLLFISVPLFHEVGEVGKKAEGEKLDDQGEVDDDAEILLVGLMMEDDSSDQGTDGSVIATE